tara:strand:+ start:7855 stop:8667 length:813 start_codon:yes stop_codon:yes gene_type:complete
MALIHPTSIIHDGAVIGNDVSIGAYSIIGPNVILADHVIVHPHVVIAGYTSIGKDSNIYSFASIGYQPQDLKYKNDITYLIVGERCIIRENVTIHSGTINGNSTTRIGNDCFFMVSSHVAHDCIIGNNVVLINQATLAGHTEIGDYAIIGGLSALHQHVRIGKHAFVAGMTGVEQDLIPFGIAKGVLRRCQLSGLNLIGLKRRGFSKETISLLRACYKTIFNGHNSEIIDRTNMVLNEYPNIVEVQDLASFILDKPERNLCLPSDKNIIK